MHNIIFATSPFQLMMAYETKQQFSLNDGILVVSVNKKAREYSIFLEVLKLQSWDLIIFVHDHNKLLHVPKLIRKLRKQLPRTIQLAHAEPNSVYIKAIKGSFCVTDEVIFDDGLASVVDFPHLSQEAVSSVNNYRQSRGSKSTLFKLLGCPLLEGVRLNNLTLFTIFYDELSHLSSIKQNSMAYLLECMKGESVGDDTSKEVAFIGQSFVGDHAMKLAPYINNVKKVIEQHPESILRYFPHRREDPECLKAIRALTNVVVNNSELPLEIEIVKHPKISELYSYTSTAMYTLSKLYPNLNLIAMPFFSEDFHQRDFFERQEEAGRHYKFKMFSS